MISYKILNPMRPATLSSLQGRKWDLPKAAMWRTRILGSGNLGWPLLWAVSLHVDYDGKNEKPENRTSSQDG